MAKIRKFALIMLSLSLSLLLAACEGNLGERAQETKSIAATPTSQPSTQGPDDTESLREEVCLLTCGTGAPDSAGGVDASFGIFTAEREIKYATFYVVAYNSVDDPVSCEIKGTSNATLKVTGPITKNAPSYVTFENVWYNATISYMKVMRVEIEFLDGTFYTTENPKALACGGVGVGSSVIPFEVYRTPLKNAVNKILEEKNLSAQDFIENYSKLYPDFDYAQDLMAEESYLSSYPWTLSVEPFSQSLGIEPIELLHTLTEFDYVNDRFFAVDTSAPQ